MTESEWETSSDPHAMLRLSRGLIRESPRKGRLFAVACCRSVWDLIPDARSRAAVVAASRYADGLIPAARLAEAEAEAEAAHDADFQERGKLGACPSWAAQFAAAPDAWFAARSASNFAYVSLDGFALGPEHSVQASLLRCIFGPLPFRPIRLGIGPTTEDMTRLAEAAYRDEAAPSGHLDAATLSILADALEEAGASEAAVAHLRSPGPHVRGCWALDLVLRKA